MDSKSLTYDLIVCGGGIPGVCAAITAARNGVRVALTEQRPILGGNSSSFALVPPHGAASMWHNRMAREGGILEELLMEYAYRSPVADNRRIWDLILSEWCLREPNLDLYLNARLDGCQMRGDEIVSVDVTQSSTETAFRFHAPLFVDGTGDGFLAAAAGANVRIGREGTEEFGETLAPPQGDSKTLPCALYVIAHRRDRPVPYVPPEWAAKHSGCDAFPHRPHVVDKFSKAKALNEDGSAIQLFWWFSLGGERDTIKDSEAIYQDLVKEAMGVWDHLKNRCTPETRESLECYEAVWWSPFPLRRESRRVMGDHILIESDIFEPKLFDDRVSYGGWPVDVHPPEGIYSKGPPCDQTFVNELYSVPFRTMYSENISNLLLVGRCISVSHVAMGSIRVMNSLGAAAHAVGMAAALSKRHGGLTPRKIAESHIGELQQLLLKADSHIISMRNEDPADLARSATVTTSSVQPYAVGDCDDFLPLNYDLAQQIPVSAGRVDTVKVLLRNDRSEVSRIFASVTFSDRIGRFDSEQSVVETPIKLAAGQTQWMEIEVNQDVSKDRLLWIGIAKHPGVAWGYSRHETFGTRFAARFSGELVPRPSHGKARIAPVTDDWFPINHNGRLPMELHDWIGETIGIEFDRKVRATLCHQVSPSPNPYCGTNAINGVSRATDWPNLWASGIEESLPQRLTLRWESPQTIRDVYLTFDTDLDAPDRCYGWPREAHRFVFPVPECVKDYRIMGSLDGEPHELLQVEGNYHRRRIHSFPEPVVLDELTVEVSATHGSASARIYEIRVY
jgi:hypothetical protein